ncbi:putative bifunctional diguanylate cyclase/phosphodiesterase [Pararhizobium sp.]|uniref:putative bifunctional diguanylate cyclase/phosphodiesterase n=1 Tax=Pararhizobium sp. TaxID=1977563 RepID=UPI002715E778|nr:bifunctional diguanylate cyclase/phosphodiesterase [Pararhizobium sp.]MDO9414583.1 bifunctional diguanylate cyclase/phosphodiesterase [Pararhizobium sp.]
MLKAFLPKMEQRYAFAGAAIGMMFPAISVISAVMARSPAYAWSEGLFAGLCCLPIVSGAVAYRMGKTRSGLIDNLHQHEKDELRLIRNAHQDPLTGLGNRFALEEDISGLITGKSARIALLLIDLDKFKFVNDTLGHDAGDALLTSVANRLDVALAGQATVYRLGGDEFVATIPGAPSSGTVADLCQLIAGLFIEPFDIFGAPFSVGGSIGATFLELDDRSMSQLLKRADLALYKAKSIPGNASMFYNAAMAEEAGTRQQLEADLSRALRNGEFFLEYQPIVGVESRAVRSFEALLRWQHPVKGVIQPDLFIPIAENSGLILPMGNWVVKTACEEAARWPAPTGVAVNVAGNQFKDRAFVGFIKQCLAETGLAPGRLTIEITESIFSVDPGIIGESLSELRRHGVRVALDDFGIGFSSINNLRNFPLDQLKVDRSFANAMLGSQRDAELVDLILKLGAMFQVTTTIEGIETEGQLDFIRSLGAAEAQGFLISRPVPADDVLAFLEREAMPSAISA